ncbi:hypothetical protein OAN72_00030 [bacterium]|nr:hypothetical protein [bacterium]
MSQQTEQHSAYNNHEFGKPLRNKKKRSAVFIVVVISVGVHVLGLGIFGVIKIVETIAPPPEFEAPPIVEMDAPPPPPPPPPPTKRTQKSLPRPQPLAAKNPQNMSVPAIVMQESDVSFGRGVGGGFGEIGGGILERVNISAFGFDRAMENTLEGNLYDFKRDEKGKAIPNLDNSNDKIRLTKEVMLAFSRNFDLSKLDRDFAKSDKSLYASYFIIPNQSANAAPKAFSVEGEMQPSAICAVYRGTYRPQKGGRFRLMGKGDDVLIVSVNGKIVLDASWSNGPYSSWRQSSAAARTDEGNGIKEFGLGQPRITGNWFDLREGVETEVEIVIAEVPGGRFGAYLLIQEEGMNPRIFSTRPLSKQDKEFLRKSHRDAAKYLD